jgi:hypothetical protein
VKSSVVASIDTWKSMTFSQNTGMTTTEVHFCD